MGGCPGGAAVGEQCECAEPVMRLPSGAAQVTPRRWRGGDMLCRSVARSNADLQRAIDRMAGFDGIVRASTAITLENPVPLRFTPLVRQASRHAP